MGDKVNTKNKKLVMNVGTNSIEQSTHVEGYRTALVPIAEREPYVKSMKFCCVYGGGFATGKLNERAGKLLLVGTPLLLEKLMLYLQVTAARNESIPSCQFNAAATQDLTENGLETAF